MPASSRRPPLAAVILLLPAAIALLLSLSCCPVAAANYGGSRAVAAAAGAAPVDSEWLRRRLEDEVAPEFGGMLAQGANQPYIIYKGLNKDRQACGGRGCAAAGASYTRPCTYADRCRGAGG
ncbi:hypothetical protein GQ55_3G444200 [Panicum hallii var. hallii]|uniref:Uncharacterized protein n=1 Tax=Panicum hallii var. hallii TaxID=1504633 RepID=A0A2T7EI89_9POAL|nr:hypothetical protein GQ55_3G444200 [Panicum hallii var. hallii]